MSAHSNPNTKPSLDWAWPVRKILHLLFGDVPQKEASYAQYNRVRQHYIDAAIAAHFNRRDDDPAPLYKRDVLDIGCGVSSIGSFLALSGGDITALDNDEAVLHEARANAAKYGTDMTFIHGTPSQLLQSNKQYDVVLCLDVLEEVQQADKFLWTLANLVKEDGVIVFSSINRTFKAWLIHIFLSSYIYKRTQAGVRTFQQFYTPAKMTEKLSTHGLHVANVQGLAFKDKTWRLSAKPETRYIAIATKR